MASAHLVEFNQSLCLTVDCGQERGSQLLQLRSGSRLAVIVIPRHHGRREIADLILENGGVARDVPYEYFQFIDTDDLIDPAA